MKNEKFLNEENLLHSTFKPVTFNNRKPITCLWHVHMVGCPCNIPHQGYFWLEYIYVISTTIVP